MNLHKSSIVFDAHVDTLLRVLDRKIDLGPRNQVIHLDIPRLKEGGVDIQVFALWVSPAKYPGKEGVKRGLDLMNALHGQIKKNPDDLELALSVQQSQEIVKKGKIACFFGIEGGHTIDKDLGNLKMFYDKGVRYMTLTWSKTNDLADSSEDKEKWKGLSPFGTFVVKEMNRLGMIVDISHVSEKVADQVLDMSTKPVIFSHSGCRSLSDTPRNVSDNTLKKLKKNGGVIGIVFYSKFILPPNSKKEKAELDDVLNHIDHAVKIAGIDHVGLGSDFDGADNFPIGLEDCSKYPAITDGLLKRGYKESDIRKILGENFLRVFKAQESGN